MPVSQLVALRNLKPGVTVITPQFNDPKVYLEFQAAGDPSGGDIQYISEELAATPSCVKAIMHGVLALEENTMSPEVAQAFQQQMDVATSRRKQAEAQIQQSIDRPQNRDLVGQTCVGPGERAGSTCGAVVAMQDRAHQDTAPLCARHFDLATQYVRVEDDSYDPDSGRPRGCKWLRTHIESRQREQV